MASLVIHLHPELQKSYPRLDFTELNPACVFGIPMPETTEESRRRLGYDTGFDDSSAAVDSISKLQNNEQYL